MGPVTYGDFLAELPRDHPTVMWVGAHPDDEIIVAPLLARVRFEMTGKVVLLVATRGEGGNTLVPLGEHPDVGAIRVEEMRDAANVLGASLVQWDLGNGPHTEPSGVIERWAKRAGGKDKLVDTLARAIRDASADALVTFDPRHGTTFHPDHRALGTLVIKALELLGDDAPQAFLHTSRIEGFPTGDQTGFRPMVPDEPGLLCYDATEHLPNADHQAWDYAALVAAAHPSQMPRDRIAAVNAAPPELRRIYVLKLTDGLRMDDPRYVRLAP